MPETSVNYIQ